MLDNFFLRALIGCIGIAILIGPFGCILVWQRMAYFGDTMAHSSLLGVALAFLFRINITLSVFIVILILAIILLLLQEYPSLAWDSLLGVIAHSSLAIALVILSFFPWIRQDLSLYLFGDVLSISKIDIMCIWGGGSIVLFILIKLWRSLIATTVSSDIAEAEGLYPKRTKTAFILLLALIITIAMKIIGILLITAFLILPPNIARHLSYTPEKTAILAAISGAISTFAGLYFSAILNTPSGPTIVVTEFILFIFSLLSSKIVRREKKSSTK
ncbi:MAG: zinc transport system permease protein [Candidatus Tokpelaia sp. JSC161]|jgi:zinc transport system permease protein|nr:MAG: zinc transport system permease protein [Candidatus Tokpelaia sp. JSC161]